MTFVEKAIERLNKLIEQSAENSEEHTDYMVMKQACEKQIPKKPVKMNQACPRCGDALTYKQKYCVDCGQRMNWGDEQ